MSSWVKRFWQAVKLACPDMIVVFVQVKLLPIYIATALISPMDLMLSKRLQCIYRRTSRDSALPDLI